MGFTTKRLQLAVAGSGDPRAVLTPYRQQLVYALLEHTSVGELGKAFSLNEQDVKAELEYLEAAGLVAKQEKTYIPTFLVASHSEAVHVDAQAKRTAAVQAEYLALHWAELMRVLHSLGSGTSSTHDLTFMMIGNGLLDQGLLAALAHEGQLMLPMWSDPLRPDHRSRHFAPVSK